MLWLIESNYIFVKYNNKRWYAIIWKKIEYNINIRLDKINIKFKYNKLKYHNRYKWLKIIIK